MTLSSIRTLCALTATFVLFAACAVPPGEPDETAGDEEETAEASLPMTGIPFSPSAGIVKILVPDGAGTAFRTGVLLAPDKVLTGLAAIPPGTSLASVTVSPPGQPDVGVSARADNTPLGATLLTLSQNVAGPVWPRDTTDPATLVGLNPPKTVTCPGYTPTGASVHALGTLVGAQSPGYQVTFSFGSSIDTTDDGVPCYNDAAKGILGIALSTAAGTHTQVSMRNLAPWLADPTLKPLSFTRKRYHNGAGTLASPSGLLSCNNLAYGSTCSASYMNTTPVTLVAAPAAGSATQWTGCTSKSGNTCNVTMNGAKNVSVTFVGCTNCYDDCITSCADVGGLPMSTCVPSCTSKCNGCGF